VADVAGFDVADCRVSATLYRLDGERGMGGGRRAGYTGPLSSGKSTHNDTEEIMASKGWGWVGKYVIVITAALILGVVIGNFGLFKSATLGNPKFTAALLVQFISHGAALALLWMMGHQAAAQLRDSGEQTMTVSTIVLAFVSLITTGMGYVVLTNFIGPFLTPSLRQAVDWVFILGVVGTAAWFVVALFTGSDDMIASIRDGMTGKKRA
jgi:uncharacterized membrane protein YdcZ (DUF606 family)